MFTKEFKWAAVRRLEQRVAIAEMARALEVSPNVLHRWWQEFRQGHWNAFSGSGKQRWAEGRIAELDRKVEQQTLEIDFVKGISLERIEEERMLQMLNGNPAVTGSRRWRIDQSKALELHRECAKDIYGLVGCALRPTTNARAACAQKSSTPWRSS